MVSPQSVDKERDRIRYLNAKLCCCVNCSSYEEHQVKAETQTHTTETHTHGNTQRRHTQTHNGDTHTDTHADTHNTPAHHRHTQTHTDRHRQTHHTHTRTTHAHTHTHTHTTRRTPHAAHHTPHAARRTRHAARRTRHATHHRGAVHGATPCTPSFLSAFSWNEHFVSRVGTCRWLCPWCPCLEMAMVASFPEVLASLLGTWWRAWARPTSSTMAGSTLSPILPISYSGHASWVPVLQTWKSGLKDYDASHKRRSSGLRRLRGVSRSAAVRSLLTSCPKGGETARLRAGRPEAHAQMFLLLLLVVGAGPEGEARRRPRGVLPREEQTGTSGSGRRQWPSLWTCWVSWSSRLP